MNVWDYYGNVPVAGAVGASIIVGVVDWLSVLETWCNVGLVFIFKLLL